MKGTSVLRKKGSTLGLVSLDATTPCRNQPHQQLPAWFLQPVVQGKGRQAQHRYSAADRHLNPATTAAAVTLVCRWCMVC